MRVTATADGRVKIVAGPAFLSELGMSEEGATSDGGELAEAGAEEVADVCSYSGSLGVIVVSQKAARYICKHMLYHIDIWGGQGWEGSRFVRSGYALSNHLYTFLAKEA